MRRYGQYLIPLLFLVGFGATAETFLDKHELTGLRPVTRSETFVVPAPPGTKVAIVYKAIVRGGSFSLTPVDAPEGLPFRSFSHDWAVTPRQTTGATSMGLEIPPGGLKIEVKRDKYLGEWILNVQTLPGPSIVRDIMPSGLLMTGVALAFFLYWWFKVRPGWRWFGIGALLWTVGVALKFAVAIPLNGPLTDTLSLHVPIWAYLLLGSLYCGLMTGIFEIGPVWLAAWRWRGMTLTPARAVAVGIGAGVFEALLLGLLNVFQGVILSTKADLGDELLTTLGFMLQTTPLVMLVGPVERLLTIFAHIGSRTLVLYGVATHRKTFGWLGFWLLTLVDTVAGFAYFTGYVGGHNLWYIEAAIFPFALLGIWGTRYCIRRWPPVPEEGPVEEPPVVEELTEV